MFGTHPLSTSPLLSTEADKYPLHTAATNADVSALYYCLNIHRMSVNALGYRDSTALMEAVKAERLDIVKILVNEYHADLFMQDRDDNIALTLAIELEARTGNAEIFQFLCAKLPEGSADTWTDSEGHTLLQISANLACTHAMAALVEKGAQLLPVFIKAAHKANLKVINALLTVSQDITLCAAATLETNARIAFASSQLTSTEDRTKIEKTIKILTRLAHIKIALTEGRPYVVEAPLRADTPNSFASFISNVDAFSIRGRADSAYSHAESLLSARSERSATADACSSSVAAPLEEFTGLAESPGTMPRSASAPMIHSMTRQSAAHTTHSPTGSIATRAALFSSPIVPIARHPRGASPANVAEH